MNVFIAYRIVHDLCGETLSEAQVKILIQTLSTIEVDSFV
jgi:hypothetical protein